LGKKRYLNREKPNNKGGNNMKAKGQAAMEYLMTYGWAIIIIIVAVAALYTMGVFNVGAKVTCSPCFSYFAYVDYSSGELAIKNSANEIGNIAATYTTVNGSSGSLTVTPSTTAGAGENIRISGIPPTGDQKIRVSYTITASGYEHNDTATIKQ
jgi:hypothetical protein